MIAVLAGDHYQYKKWKSENYNRASIFCDSWPKFAGFEFNKIVVVGDFWDRKDAKEIMEKVLPMVRTLR